MSDASEPRNGSLTAGVSEHAMALKRSPRSVEDGQASEQFWKGGEPLATNLSEEWRHNHRRHSKREHARLRSEERAMNNKPNNIGARTETGNLGGSLQSKMSSRYMDRRRLHRDGYHSQLRRKHLVGGGTATAPDMFDKYMQAVLSPNGTRRLVQEAGGPISRPVGQPSGLRENSGCRTTTIPTTTIPTAIIPKTSICTKTTPASRHIFQNNGNSRTIEVDVECPYCHNMVEIDLLQPKRKAKTNETQSADSKQIETTSWKNKTCTGLKTKVKKFWSNIFCANETSRSLQDPDVDHFRNSDSEVKQENIK